MTTTADVVDQLFGRMDRMDHRWACLTLFLVLLADTARGQGCGLSAFRHVPETHCRGDELVVDEPQVGSALACAQACCDNPACKSFQYSTYGDCLLISKICTDEEKETVSIGNMYDRIQGEARPQASAGCGLSAFRHVPGTHCRGDELVVDRPQVGSVEACAKACCDNPACKSFQFSSYSDCHLISKICTDEEKVTVPIGNMYDRIQGAISAQSYKGCYKRKWGTFRTMDSSDDMTNEKCVEICAEEDLPYAGTYETKCGCGRESELTRLGDPTDESECASTCGGDVTQKCGQGNGLLTVWATGKAGPPAPSAVPPAVRPVPPVVPPPAPHAPGTGWTRVAGALKYVSVGEAGVWGVNRDGMIYYRVGTYGNENAVGTTWQKVAGALTHISVGSDVVWGVNADGYIYRRMGISRGNPTGSSWRRVPGKLKMVHVSSTSNAVWGVDKEGKIYRWTGSTWQLIPGQKTFISVGKSGVWGVNSAGHIWYRVGTAFNENSAGTGWVRIQGLLAQISVGNGIVWGVNSKGEIYYRAGITRQNPTGTTWKRIYGGKTAVEVSSSSNQLWGVNGAGHIYKRTGIISASKRTVEVGETLQDLRDVLLDLEEAAEIEQETRELEDMGGDVDVEEDTEKDVRELEGMGEDVDMAEDPEKELGELEEIDENAGMAAEDDE